jgi:asparagine synthase (glutamine-hydrolysing)
MDDGSERERYALLLSGGLDSRALLAAAERPLLCFTTCATFNNEAEVAQEVAQTAGAEFVFVPRPARPYDGHISDLVFYGGGQHLLTEGQFIDYESSMGTANRCHFIGLGLDVFLGGLYLPKQPVRWFGRDTLHSRLNELGDDVASAFIDGVKYRLKTDDPWDVVADGCKSRLREQLHTAIEEIANQGRALGAQGYDLWEYLHLHNFGRHYSLLMIQSIRHWGECRAPALCNDLLDITIRLPAELKANSTAYLDALNRMSPRLMKIRNANTNIAAGVSFPRQSAVRAVNKVMNVLGAQRRVSPLGRERSWPTPRETIAASEQLQTAVNALPLSERLASVGIFDLDRVRSYVNDHNAGRRDHSILLLALTTVDEFLRQVS